MTSPLMQPTAPYFHCVETWEGAPEATVCVVPGHACADEAGLMRAFAQAMQFPDYFGGNWDALDECLTDLEWLPTRHIVVVLLGAGAVLADHPDAREVLVEILATTAEAWGEAADEAFPMSFHVVLQDGPEALQAWKEELTAQAVSFD